MSLSSRPGRSARSRRALVGAGVLALVTGSLAAVGLSAAVATTTVSPTEPGSPHPVVRADSVDISIDSGAKTFYRGSASAAFAAQAPAAVALGLTACRGDNPAGTNNSPRDQVTVTGPDGASVLSETTPVRDIGISGFLTSPPHKPASPQPAPGNSNYRGDFPGNTHHGLKLTLDLTGKPAGVYTVVTTTRNAVKTGLFGGCAIGTPGPGTTVVPGPVVETTTFEYRPWQATFKDVLGKGRVSANVTPREFQLTIGAKSSTVITGNPESQSFYSLGGSFLLPSDPAACAALITSCLPRGAEVCEPSAGCVPRLMLINQPVRENETAGLIGVFDLETKAFIATATVDGTSRALMSLGTDNDALYRSTLQSLAAAASAQGVDLLSILGTEVVASNGSSQTSLSLLNGLQIDPTTKPGGVRLVSDATVQAGIILDIYSSLRLSGGACVANSASSSTAPARYTRKEDNGYTVTRSDALPSVPRVGPLGPIVGGPVFHVKGKFNGATAPLVNTATAVVGVDTATDEPNGYPVWISPFVSGIHTAKPRTMEFVGTGTWSATESPIASGCLVVDFLLGTGVAVYNNPLPVGLGSLIDAVGTPSPELATLSASVDTALTDALTLVTSNPTVDTVLGQLLDTLALPAVPGVPVTP